MHCTSNINLYSIWEISPNTCMCIACLCVVKVVEGWLTTGQVVVEVLTSSNSISS